MISVLFAGSQDDYDDFRGALRDAFVEADLNARLAREMDPSEVDYIVFAGGSGEGDFSRYTRCKAVLSLWAGVEGIVANPTLSQPLTRMVDPGLTEGMVEWVAGHLLRYHLGIDATLSAQDGTWARHVPPLARERRVTVLGLGALGSAVATALSRLNFQVTGWSRSPRQVSHVRCLSGEDALPASLDGADFLVLLLPLTPATENILGAAEIEALSDGAIVLNPARGALIDDAALISALDRGKLSHATLDVFRTEPLPPQHPFWSHPRITVTPHIASATRPSSASRVIAENIRRSEADEPLLYTVDRALGY